MKSSKLNTNLKFNLIFTLILMFTTGCVLIKKATVLPTPVFSDWTTRFFDETLCQLPCWEGIIPGKTTIYEATDILRETSIYKNVKDPVEVMNRPLNYHYVSWLTSQGNGGGMVWSLEGEEAISKITLALQNESPKITLINILYFFGDPDSLIVEEVRGNICVAHIFYLKKGMEIVLIKNCNNKSIKLESQSEIYEVSLFPLNSPSFPEVKGWATDIKRYLVAWNGYGKYMVTKDSRSD